MWFLLLEEFSKDLCFSRGRLGDRDGNPIHVTRDMQWLGGGSVEVPLVAVVLRGRNAGRLR